MPIRLLALTLCFCARFAFGQNVPAGRIFYAPFDGSFDLFVAELMFRDEAWLKSSYRGQQRHGRGYRDDVSKQLTKLFIF